MNSSTTFQNARTLAVAGGLVLLAGLAFVHPIHAQGTPAMHSDRVTVGDLDVYYEVHGELSPGGTPILLMHGGMGSIQTDFATLLPALAENHVVIGVDQQGHGRTGGREDRITLNAMRQDTLAVLDDLDVERVHVVGFSMGGMLALELGVYAPERVATLTAISATQNIEGMHPDIVAMNRDPSHQPAPEIASLLPTEEDFAQMQAGFADNPSGPEQFERTFGQLNAFITSDWGWSDEELASITAPTFLALGDTDFAPVEHAASMATLIQDAQLAVLPDTTHLTIMRRPEWLVPMIENRISTASELSSDEGR